MMESLNIVGLSYACIYEGMTAIYSGSTLSHEPLGFSLSRVEPFLGRLSWPNYVVIEGERELRELFWCTFWGVVSIPADLRPKAKAAKDIGFVVDCLRNCSSVDDTTPYQLIRLEDILRLSSGEVPT
jgi:hypothetical protein